MLNKKYFSYKSIDNIRLIHFSSILHTENNNTNNDLDELELTAEEVARAGIALSEEDVNNLQYGLQDIKKNSEAMSLSEYFDTYFSSFDESFPNLRQNKVVNEYLKTINTKDFYEKGMSNTESIIEKIPELKNINSVFLTTNENIGSRLVNNLNNQISEVMNYKEASTKLIEYTADGKIIIDGKKFLEVWDKTSKVLNENIKEVSVGGSVCLFGIGSLLLYKGIVRAHDISTTVDLSSFKTDKARLQALKMINRNKFIFNSCGALVVMTGIYGMLSLFKETNKVDISVNTSTSLNKTNNSIFLFFSCIKNLNKWAKLFIVFIILVLVIFLDNTYLGCVFKIFKLFISNNILKIKIYISLIIGLIILYNILILKIINKFKNLYEKPILPKFIPSFIKSEIMNLYEISKFDELEKNIIINNIIQTNLFMFILFLLSIISILIHY